MLLIIAIYVDDMILLSDKSEGIRRMLLIEDKLSEIFEMTNLGDPKWLLSMEVERDRAARTISISQRQHIENVLEQHGMSSCRPVSTPIAANLHLPKLSLAEIDARKYQSALGSLMYLMLGNRPDIAYAIGILSQHAATPGKAHWDALMRVYRYLRGTTNLKLTYRGSSKAEELLGYVDADFAGDTVDRRSTTGYAFILSGAAVSWASKKQRTVATSSTEAEYVAGSEAAKEAVWFRLILSELGMLKEGPTEILIDNQSAIALAKNPVFHGRMKHVEVQHHFIREKLEDGVITAEYVPTGDQVADVLTKGLAREKHDRFVKGLGLE